MSRAQPTPADLALLRAALAPGEEALAGWSEWKVLVPLDDAPGHVQRLLPLLYRNLSRLAPDEPDLGRLKGIYRRAWYANQLLLKGAATGLEALHATGVETMVLKGAPLAVLHYGDVGVRPMADVDVLVPTGQAHTAIDAMRAAGWVPLDTGSPETALAFRHAEGFRRDGGAIDLHWNALWQPGSDDALWEAAGPVEVAGFETRSPSPTDLLFLVSAHRASFETAQLLGSLADAHTLLRTADRIDWERLVRLARARSVTVAVAHTLGLVGRIGGVSIPAETLAELERTAAPRWERSGFRAASRRHSPLATLRLTWERYQRLRNLDTPFPRPGSFVAYAKATWGVERGTGLVGHVARRGAAYGAARVRAVLARSFHFA